MSAPSHSAATAPPAGAYRAGRARDSVRSWPLADRIAYVLCWTVGIGLCLVTVAIVLFFAVKGISYLRPYLLFEHPSASTNQSESGGFLDPIEGTLILSAVGIAIAAPLGVGLGVWLAEYGRPYWLARAAESGVEMTAGAPSVLLAIFGLVFFARPVLAFLSQTSAGGSVSGKSFLTAGAMMSLLAIPLIVGSAREALMQVPAHLREASYALGKTKARTIRKVLLPAIRPNIATGITLGIGRIVGDTAIVVILMGGELRLAGAGGLPVLSTLRGEGGTLASYVYLNSPSGEGNAPQKAYAAAFVLILIVLALNLLALRIGFRREEGKRAIRSWIPWTGIPWIGTR
jgi:phosphate transport system permease protein